MIEKEKLLELIENWQWNEAKNHIDELYDEVNELKAYIKNLTIEIREKNKALEDAAAIAGQAVGYGLCTQEEVDDIYNALEVK